MAADSFHHQVELSMKHSGKVYDFPDFVDCVRRANSGKVDIKVLGAEDFFSWKDCTSKTKTKSRGDSMPYLRDIVKVIAERGETSLFYATKYEEPCLKVLNFLQAKCIKNFPLPDKIGKFRGLNKTKKNKKLSKRYAF